jgi:hypothetical protein
LVFNVEPPPKRLRPEALNTAHSGNIKVPGLLDLRLLRFKFRSVTPSWLDFRLQKFEFRSVKSSVVSILNTFAIIRCSAHKIKRSKTHRK